MPTLLLVASLAAPLGLLAPVEPTDDDWLHEPETVAPEPAPAPAQASPFGPSATVIQPAFNLPPPPPPPDGSGRLVGGGFAIALGVGAAAAVVVEGSREAGNQQFVAATFIPIALASVGLGTYLLVRGAKARRNYNDWRIYASHEGHPTGDGLLVGGTISVLVGGVTLLAAAGRARQAEGFDGPLTPTLLGIGATGVAVGVGALSWGFVRRKSYRSWREATFLGSLTPTITPLYASSVGSPARGGWGELRGVSFGFVGRM